MDIKKYIEEKGTVVTREIEKILSQEPRHPLSEAMSYALEGGKRFRPILVMAGAEACGMPGEKTMYAAVAMEMIHNFSLIHDDLPCMDNDWERRGKPSVHAKFGEANGLLCGDALLIFAFNLIARCIKVSEISNYSALKILELFSGAAGHQGMTGGQVLDMFYQEEQKIEIPQLEELHRKKTGALITASTVAGGILAGASSDKIKALETFGENIGFTYQIIDDILDMESDAAPISFPQLMGKEKSYEKAREATEKAVQALSFFDEKAEPLREIAKFLLNRKK